MSRMTRRRFCGLVVGSAAGAGLIATGARTAPQPPSGPRSLDDLFGTGTSALRKLIDQFIPGALAPPRTIGMEQYLVGVVSARDRAADVARGSAAYGALLASLPADFAAYDPAQMQQYLAERMGKITRTPAGGKKFERKDAAKPADCQVCGAPAGCACAPVKAPTQSEIDAYLLLRDDVYTGYFSDAFYVPEISAAAWSAFGYAPIFPCGDRPDVAAHNLRSEPAARLHRHLFEPADRLQESQRTPDVISRLELCSEPS